MKKIYIHGNCQATALHTLLAASLPEWEIVSCEVFSVNLTRDKSEILHHIRTADVIFAQPIADNYRSVDWLSTGFVRSQKNPQANLIIFPVLYFKGYHPQCISLLSLPDWPIAYHDMHAIDMFLHGYTSDDYLYETGRADFFAPEFSRSELFLSLNELAHRETREQVDVKVSDVILSNFSNHQLFLTLNHPTRFLLSIVARRLMAAIGEKRFIDHEGPEPLDQVILPPYLSTAINLSLTLPNINLDQCKPRYDTKTRKDFAATTFQFYKEIGQEKLKAAWSSNRNADDYLARFKAAKQAPRADERAIIEGWFDIFMGRSVETVDIAAHVQRVRILGWPEALYEFLNEIEFKVSGAQRFIERFCKPIPPK